MRSYKLNRVMGFALGCAGVFGFALLPSVAHAGGEAQFDVMDTNGDGKISPDEHDAAAARMFAKMDTNADGKVTAAEMTAAKQNLTGKKAEKGEMTAAEKIKRSTPTVTRPDRRRARGRSEVDVRQDGQRQRRLPDEGRGESRPRQVHAQGQGLVGR